MFLIIYGKAANARRCKDTEIVISIRHHKMKTITVRVKQQTLDESSNPTLCIAYIICHVAGSAMMGTHAQKTMSFVSVWTTTPGSSYMS